MTRMGSESDARIVRTRAAVLRAATDLLVQGGPAAVTIDAVVARSGVAKSTVYRHWESRDDVLLDAIERSTPMLTVPDLALGFEEGVRDLMEQARCSLNDPEWGRILPALLMLRNHERDFANLEARFDGRQRLAMEAVVALGVAEGRLPPDVDVDEACALLMGPLLFAHLSGRPAVTRAFAERVLQQFLARFDAPVGARAE